jgi:hypothetical protein
VASYKIAHIKVEGQDMILVPLDHDFAYRSDRQKADFLAYLQGCAKAAGLRGNVVLAWEDSGLRTTFLGPREWGRFLGNADLQFVWSNVNRQLTCR